MCFICVNFIMKMYQYTSRTLLIETCCAMPSCYLYSPDAILHKNLTITNYYSMYAHEMLHEICDMKLHLNTH